MIPSATSLGLARSLAILAEGRDNTAWGCLIAGVGNDLWRLSLHLSGDRNLAEDAMQETLLQLRDLAGRFKPHSENPDQDARRWILGVAANTCLHLMRRRGREQGRDVRAGLHQAADRSPAVKPEDAMEREETAALVRHELAKLPDPYRSALALHFLGEHDMAEVAGFLRVPVATAKTHVHRGLERLRQQLARVGVALSLTILAGMLQDLTAAEVGALPASVADQCHSLLEAARTPSVDVTALSTKGLTMASTLVITGVAAAVLTLGAVPLILRSTAPLPARSPEAQEAALTQAPSTNPSPGAPAIAHQPQTSQADPALSPRPHNSAAPLTEPSTVPPSTVPPTFGTPAINLPPDDVEPLDLALPKPMYIGTPKDIKSSNLEPLRTGPRPALMVPRGLNNLALKCPVTASDSEPVIGDLTMATDGDKAASSGSFVEFGPGAQWLQIDLGAPSEVFAVVLWHFHSEARVYHDVVVQMADDQDFTVNVRTLFNNDDDNSSGLGIGKDFEYIDNYEGRLIDARGRVGRFLRCSSRGNTANDLNHYVEIEAWGRKR